MHEFINNAARHAFARGKGSIRVELARAGAFVECRVLDDGSAAPNVQLDRGLKIINALTKGLGGRFEQSFGSRGSIFVVAFPYNRAAHQQEHPTAVSGITEPRLDKRPER